MELQTKQFHFTVSAGKRLIAKSIITLEPIKKALNGHTIVVIAGSTNGYVAEELLTAIGQKGDFSKNSFMRGLNVGPGRKAENGAYNATDVVIESGLWVKGKTIFDVAADLGCDDVIIKGANALDLKRKLAGISIGHPALGTSGPILQAALGRKAQLILPIGLEKRVTGNIAEIAALLSSPSASGTRLLPVSGTIITELEAVELLTGASAQLVSAGGVLGAEGSYWIAVTGTEGQLKVASDIIKSIINEPPFGE